MILYKYMPFRKSFFSNRLLRASGRKSLNDPFEFAPSVEYISDLFLQTNYYRLGNSKEEIEANLKDINDLQTWKHMEGPMLSNYGIISMSETYDNLLMWAHYANEHKGIIVGFDTTDDFFTKKYAENGNDVSGKIHRVLYRQTRVNTFKNFHEPFFVKANEWMYEKEHRFLVNLHSCDKKLIHKNMKNTRSSQFNPFETIPFSDDFEEISSATFPGSLVHNQHVMFMFEFPFSAIKCIGMGARMDPEDKHEINQLIIDNSDLHHVELIKFSLDRYRFELNVAKVSKA